MLLYNRQHLEILPSAVEIKGTAVEATQLRGGSLLGSSPAVQVHKDAVDEGDQAEHRQANVNLKVEGKERVWRQKWADGSNCFFSVIPYTHIERVSIENVLHQGQAEVLQLGEECRQSDHQAIHLPKVAQWEPAHRHTTYRPTLFSRCNFKYVNSYIIYINSK